MDEQQNLRHEIARRRTFAIISHPDAGKTTLTEKMLLYGGAIHVAGAVKQRRASRHATSDWMAIERERGISITTSVMQFEHLGCHMNLLDTPGHNDFSEDTYRTLAAADCAVMLIDSVKGVEPQTIKLFEVCRLRRIPIVTFINKMDRFGKEPLELLDEIERVLGIPCTPLMWPVGAGTELQGVVDRHERVFHRFERAEKAGQRARTQLSGLDDPSLGHEIGQAAHEVLLGEIALLDGAADPFDLKRFLAGEQTPVFFGSAITSFGVEPFLDRFIELAPPPRERQTSNGLLAPDTSYFSGFVFKIQANMDPNHRDRVAFVRICSGRFHRGMQAKHPRTGKKLTLSRSLHFMGQERVSVEEGYPGDIVGLWDPGVLRIGDTLSSGEPVEFEGIPRFSPEHFVRVRVTDALKHKAMKKGIEQLTDEGAVQVFYSDEARGSAPVLGAVGLLQFEVVRYRMQHEYGVEVELDPLPYRHARWVEGEGFDPGELVVRGSVACLWDVEDRPLLLFESDWIRERVEQRHPRLRFIASVQPGRASRSR
jgi:peptide chain release factor 3